MFNLSKEEKRIVAIPLTILFVEVVGILLWAFGVFEMFKPVNNCLF